ncbi:conserved hypothetical protein [Methanolacinia petrolearia DSM 11571]|uniref:KaiC-like domain-containing protein n=1 Tax=Methanolacinia petrolearia (strain DSM 11571 / OCM 486 / SEBR 4847) TaxID=679926 RepID=E1RET8_METP4|nr:hypothetical protein [Methanolacinia petrolearia]ADN36109.1 conserved hypothetical protein [Methanolacinia petrolearia DSM 11571]
MVSIDNLSPDLRTFFVRSGPMGVRNRNHEIVSALTEMDYTIVVVSTNVPSELQIAQYEKEGINTSNLFFIDMITAYAKGKKQKDTDQIHYIDRPGDLTKAGIIVTRHITERQGEKVAFLFDTINTMLIYSNQLSVSRFIHFVINKLRLTDLKGFFIMVEKSIDANLVADFEMLADMSIPRDEPITLINSEIKGKIGVPEENSYEEFDIN